MSGAGPVGVGVIGAGNISTQYLENLTTFPDLVVLFVADIDVPRAREQAARYGVPSSGTVAELLAHPGIEIVVNLTIPAAHVEVALSVLAAGKHVWTEKPMGLDRVSAQTVLDSASERGLRAATAPDTILGPGLQTGKRLISEGRIGTPLTALALMQASGPESWHPNPDFLYAKGAGPLFDMGPYYLTALVQNLGPVRRVAAQSSTSRQTRTIGSGPRAGEVFPVQVPTHFGVLIEFESSASAQCIFSFQSGLSRSGLLEISGAYGTVALPDPDGFDGEISVFGTETPAPEVIVTASSFGRGAGVVDLARSIRADVPEQASAEQAFHVLDIMVAIAESAESGDYVDVLSTTRMLPALAVDWNPRSATL